MTRILPERLRVSAYYRLKPKVPISAFESATLNYAPGVRMKLRPGDDFHSVIAAVGVYELPSSRLAAKLARQGGLFVDVGANYGYFTAIWLANSKETTAIAIEPSPRVADCLRANLEANGLLPRTKVFELAADRETSRRGFALSPGEQTCWGHLTNAQADLHVQTVRLDELVPDQHIALLKVDCEGADAWVIEGASGLLDRGLIAAILFENNLEGCEELGIDPNVLPQILRAYGYRIRRLRDANWFATKDN
ncbi:MAG TPA: FkbM family methyltransferase [Candidatus Dormibacteraeota bacterium]|nr:FkbM family methyltransferase [Candidatus Dormibacteraeota bacterium]